MKQIIFPFIRAKCTILFLGFLFPTLLHACKNDDSLKNDPLVPKKSIYLSKYVPQSYDFSLFATLYRQADYPVIQAQCKDIDLSSISIAYIGGSLASLPESNVAKALVYDNLNCKNIYTYGHGGYGFSTSNGSFQDIVRKCNPHDIYILWCSTNDYGTGVPVGEPTDYTKEDGFDASKLCTQCGGMNYCIRYLRKLNPKAILLAFSSQKFFGQNGARQDGFLNFPDMDNGQGISFKAYIDKQTECLERNGVPYLNQWDLELFTPENFSQFFQADGFHMKSNGYFLVGCKQLEFIVKQFK